MLSTQSAELLVKTLRVAPAEFGHSRDAQVEQIFGQTRPDAGNLLEVAQCRGTSSDGWTGCSTEPHFAEADVQSASKQPLVSGRPQETRASRVFAWLKEEKKTAPAMMVVVTVMIVPIITHIAVVPAVEVVAVV